MILRRVVSSVWPARSIRLFYFDHANFGDSLSPRLVAVLAGRSVTHCDRFDGCDLLAIGSILNLADHKAFRGAIWGSGFIQPPASDVAHYPRARIAALRGALTRRLLKAPESTPLGDPGLLADRFATAQPKRFKLGLIPHFVDSQDPLMPALAARDPRATLIDICAGVQHVIDRVAQCEAIVASCLHGLILADALGIPNVWTRLSSRVIGGDFKFLDYYSAFGIDAPRLITLTTDDDADSVLARLGEYHRPGLAEMKRGLEESFPLTARHRRRRLSA